MKQLFSRIAKLTELLVDFGRLCQLSFSVLYIWSAHFTDPASSRLRLAPLKLRPYGAIQMCILLLLLFSLYRLQNATARLIYRFAGVRSTYRFYFFTFYCFCVRWQMTVLKFCRLSWYSASRGFSATAELLVQYILAVCHLVFLITREFDFLIEILTADVFIASACVNLPNFVPIGPTVDEIMAIIWLFKMAAVGHLGFVVCVFGPPTKSIWLDTCFTYINLISYTHNLYHILCFSVASVAER